MQKYDWPSVVEQKVLTFADSKGLKGKDRDDFVALCYDKFLTTLVPIYEPVGILVAHSMGEPATQLILRTKHYAGAAEVSIGSGIERFEELVDARAKTRNPVMTLFIKKGFPSDDKALNSYIRDIIHRKFTDIADIKEDLNGHKIRITYKKDMLKKLDIDSSIIKERIKTIVKVKPQDIENGLEYTFSDVTLATIRKYFLKISDMSILGIDGVSDAIITKENDEIVISTKGTNFKQALGLEFVDGARSYTNDIFETYKVLGIEAARNLLVKEISKVYKVSDILCDIRHIFLLADSMCFDGSVKGVVRTGIVSTKASPLARAAFEQTEKVIFDAAFNGELETFSGVVENVMAGLPIKVGVGKIEVLMDFNVSKDKKE